MKLVIYDISKKAEAYEDVILITVPTVEGMVGFLKNHMTFISKLAPGELEITVKDKVYKVKVGEGYVHFKDNECKVFFITASVSPNVVSGIQ